MPKQVQFYFLNLLLILCCLHSHAGGSRVGNGTGNSYVSSDGSFQFQAPLEFRPEKRFQDGVRLKGPSFTSVSVSPGMPFPIPKTKEQMIDVLSLATEVPELNSMDRTGLENWFKSNGYRPRANENRCVIARSVKRDGLTTTLVLWGKGKGLAISADSTDTTEQSLDAILSSLKIHKGECEWN